MRARLAWVLSHVHLADQLQVARPVIGLLVIVQRQLVGLALLVLIPRSSNETKELQRDQGAPTRPRSSNETKELQERLPTAYTPARRKATAQDQVAATMRARGRGGRGRGRGALPPTPPGPPNFGAQAAAAEEEADGIAAGL